MGLEEVKMKMSLDKETKGAVRYMEMGDPGKHTLRTVYVRKSAFKGEYPKQIEVDVRW